MESLILFYIQEEGIELYFKDFVAMCEDNHILLYHDSEWIIWEWWITEYISESQQWLVCVFVMQWKLLLDIS